MTSKYCGTVPKNKGQQLSDDNIKKHIHIFSDNVPLKSNIVGRLEIINVMYVDFASQDRDKS